MSGEELINDVMSYKACQIEHLNFGPWILCISKKYKSILDSKIKTAVMLHETTVRERILRISGIKKIQLV